MKTLGTNLLATITGGAGNPAHLTMKDGCPAPTRANNRKAARWLKNNGITKDQSGNYSKADGPYPSLYGYEYYNGSRCAPGADD